MRPMQDGVIGSVRALLLSRLRPLMLGVGGLVAVLVIGSMLLDQGELVRLLTFDEESHSHETDLWIVDLDSIVYLRAGAPDVYWLVRIEERPEVVLRRAGAEARYRAVIEQDASRIAEVSREMARKYGLADRIWGRVSDRSKAVAIRLELLDAGELVGTDRRPHR